MSEEKKPAPTTWRLTVMPEVLPTPPAVSPAGSVSQRTRGHLQRIMAMVTAATTLGTACVEQSPAQMPFELPDVPGYSVVDMLPWPATLCHAMAPTMQADAAWVRDGGTWIVELALSQFGGGRWTVETTASNDGEVRRVGSIVDGGL